MVIFEFTPRQRTGYSLHLHTPKCSLAVDDDKSFISYSRLLGDLHSVYGRPTFWEFAGKTNCSYEIEHNKSI